MKSTGNVRRIDELGRIVIPANLRRQMDIAIKDPMEIYVEGEQVVLRKYLPSCVFCNNQEDVQSFDGKNVCKACLEELMQYNGK